MKKYYLLFILLSIFLPFNMTYAQLTLANWHFSIDSSTDPVKIAHSAVDNISVDHYGTHPLYNLVSVSNIEVSPLTLGQGLLDSIAANPIPPESHNPKWIYAAWGARGFGTTIPAGEDTSEWTDDDWMEARIAENKFITFSITPNPGYAVSLAQISDHNIRRHNEDSPGYIRYQYCIGDEEVYTDLLTKALGNVSSGGRSIGDIKLSDYKDLRNQHRKITFRIVLYNTDETGNGAAGFYNSDLIVKGTVAAYIPTFTYSLFLSSSDNSHGVAECDYPGDLTNIAPETEITVTAIPKDGYEFSKWNDGNTENPRTIIITKAVSMKAIFSKAATGIRNTTTDKGDIVSEIYYNINGKVVSPDTKGFVLKKITYESGEVEVIKQQLDF